MTFVTLLRTPSSLSSCPLFIASRPLAMRYGALSYDTIIKLLRSPSGSCYSSIASFSRTPLSYEVQKIAQILGITVDVSLDRKSLHRKMHRNLKIVTERLLYNDLVMGDEIYETLTNYGILPYTPGSSGCRVSETLVWLNTQPFVSCCYCWFCGYNMLLQ